MRISGLHNDHVIQLTPFRTVIASLVSRESEWEGASLPVSGPQRPQVKPISVPVVMDGGGSSSGGGGEASAVRQCPFHGRPPFWPYQSSLAVDHKDKVTLAARSAP